MTTVAVVTPERRANMLKAERVMLDAYVTLRRAVEDGCTKAYLRDLCRTCREAEEANYRAADPWAIKSAGV